jgi:hypothetical protein
LLHNDVVVTERLPLLEPHTAPSLDAWLPDYHVRAVHRRASRATPDRLWEAAEQTRIRDTRVLRPLIGARLGPHAPPADTTFRELFRTDIFTLLEEGDRYSISGVAGCLWAPRGEYARFESAADYRQYDRAGRAKAAVLTLVREHGRGSEIATEIRVWCTDRRAEMRFRSVWLVVSPFMRFVRMELLRAVARRAESA